MKKSLAILIISTLPLSFSSAHAFDLNDVSKIFQKLTGTDNQSQTNSAQPQTTVKQAGQSQMQALVDMLTKSLNVSPKQAVGGTAALLTQAKSALNDSQFSQLTKQIPGLQTLLSSATALGGGGALFSKLSQLVGGGNSAGGNAAQSAVNAAFKALGMETSTVARFSSIILGFISKFPLSSDVISTLTKLWK